jgi:hypothetical protein
MNQTRPHCVNQMGKTHSKSLAARHGRGTACYVWIRLKRLVYFAAGQELRWYTVKRTGVVLTEVVHGFLEALGANSGIVPHLSRDVFLTHCYQFTCDSTPIRNSDMVTVPPRISRVFHHISFQFCLRSSQTVCLVPEPRQELGKLHIQIMKTVDADALIWLSQELLGGRTGGERRSAFRRQWCAKYINVSRVRCAWATVNSIWVFLALKLGQGDTERRNVFWNGLSPKHETVCHLNTKRIAIFRQFKSRDLKLVDCEVQGSP